MIRIFVVVLLVACSEPPVSGEVEDASEGDPDDIVQVEAGGVGDVCARTKAGKLTCTGDLTAPSGTGFLDVGLTLFFGCALDSEREIECFGNSGAAELPQGPFVAMAAGGGINGGPMSICGLRDAGDVICSTTLGGPLSLSGPAESMSTSGVYLCAILAETREIECVGEQPFTPPSGTFRSVSVSNPRFQNELPHACAVRDDGTIACWGNDVAGETDAPAGEFIDVAVGLNTSCGIRTDHSVVCWGQVEQPPVDLRATQISMSIIDSYGCAATTDGGFQGWSGDPASLP